MSIQTIRSNLQEYAKDIKLNLSTVLSEEGAPGLTQSQIHGIALTCSYATKNSTLIEALTAETENTLSPETIEAAKSAATIMAMNNIYYRFTHLVQDTEFQRMPANLRRNCIGKPPIAKVDFELYCLSVSAINGCGMCLDAHVREVTKAGITKLGVQSAVRIAAVIHATAQALIIHSAH